MNTPFHSLLVRWSAAVACSVVTASSLFAGSTFFVDFEEGNDSAIGTDAHPFQTVARALQEVDGVGGTIQLREGMTYPESLVIRKGGSLDEPLILEGNGAVLNLGTNVTTGPWVPVGDEYRLERDLPKFKRHYVTSPLFVNGLPLWAEHPEGRGKPAWHGGSLRYDESGRMIVRFPDGLSPENSMIVLTASDGTAGIHSPGGKHIVLRNLTVAFAGNDGFNFHNDCEDVRLEEVRALFNGDQGISSHGDSQVDVEQSEVAFNGSQSAGIVDINQSVTRYVDVLCHQNRNAGFLMRGEFQELIGVSSYGNQGKNLPNPSDSVSLNDCVENEEVLPKNFPEWGSPEELSQRIERFVGLVPARN